MFTTLEKNKIIEILHYNKEHTINGFMFPIVWDVMFNQMFISSDTTDTCFPKIAFKVP